MELDEAVVVDSDSQMQKPVANDTTGSDGGSRERSTSNLQAEQADKLAQARELLENLCKKHIENVEDPNAAGPSSSGDRKSPSPLIKLRDQIWELFNPEKTDVEYLESPAFRNKIRLIENGCTKRPAKRKIHLKELIECMIVNTPKTEVRFER